MAPSVLFLAAVGLSDTPAEPVGADYDDLLKRRAAVQQRWNGAKLTISNARIEDTDTGQVLKVDWAIDYTGPRLPFTVLKPTLGPACSQQVELHGWWRDRGGKTMHVNFNVPGHDGPGPLPDPDRFATSKDGKPVTGTITVFEERLGETTRMRFTGKTPVFVQLDFHPHDRGESGNGGGLDAWTGALTSNPLTVTIAEPK
ncbi:MAG: hypothetical protein K2X87_06260 [Gemmataceae bacterium]|nr:hypothetical protein [Gemmataceae bacterium]